MADDQPSVSAFLSGPLFGSWPGRITLTLMVLTFALGLWSTLVPAATQPYLALAWGPVLMLWPLMIFIQFVKASDPARAATPRRWLRVPLVALFPFVLPYLQLQLMRML